MKTRWTALLKLLACLAAAPAAHAEIAYQPMGFPPAHEIFPPLTADPTDPHFSFQFASLVDHRPVAKINLGDYLGLYRWTFDADRGAVQVNVGGSVNNRFDANASHALQVIDYYGNVPLDVGWGIWSGRFMFYHVSSHLGDDYLRENNIVGTDASWEALRGLLSVHPWQAWRFYAGYQHAIHTKPPWSGRDALQGGMEIYFNNSTRVNWHPYLALDIQGWARSEWTPTYTTEIGIKTGGQYSQGRGISYFIQGITGPRYEGQFFLQKETLWSIGLKFQLSQAPAMPANPTSVP